MSYLTPSSNYSTILVDSVTNQLRYISPIHQFQNWGPNQNPKNPIGTILSQANACNIMTIRNNYIGIGTTNPQSILHIVANSYSSNIIYDANNTNGGLIIKNGNSAGFIISQSNIKDASIINYDSGKINILSQNQTGIVIDSSGRVGINTNYMTNTFNVNGSSFFNGNLGIGNTNPGYPLQVQGNAYIDGTLFTSNMSILGNLDIINAYTIDTSNVVIINKGPGPALSVIQSDSTSIADFYDNSITNPALRIAIGGNIGINTTLPAQKLHIYSTAGTTSPSAIILDNDQENSAGGNPAQFIQFRNLGIGTIVSDYFAFGASFNTNKNLYICASSVSGLPTVTDAKLTITQSGIVGIGITTPSASYLLDVNGSIHANNGFYGSGENLTSISVRSLTGTLSDYTVLPTVSPALPSSSQGDATNVPVITVNTKGIVTGLSSASITQSQWSGTSGNPIYYNGSVGINTNAVPSYNLDVYGQARYNHYSTQGIILKNTSTTNNANEIYFDSTSLGTGTPSATASIGIGTVSGANQRGAYWRVNSVDSINISPANNNVGIGSSVPTAKLDVNGTGNFQNTLTVNYATVTTDPSNGQLYLYNSSTANSNSASALIRVAGSGALAGKPFIGFDISGLSGSSWSIGQINTGNLNTNNFVICGNINFANAATANILSLTRTGNLTTSTFSGSGSGLTNIPASQIIGNNALSSNVLPLINNWNNLSYFTPYGNNTTVPVISIDQYGRTCNITTSSISGLWSVNTSPASYYYNNGNIGIGTNTPGQKLHIYGTSGTTIPSAIYIDNDQENSAGGNPAQFIQFRNLGTGTILTDYFSFGASFNTNKNFYICAAAFSGGISYNPTVADAKLTLTQSGSIGIGITIPSSILHLYSNSITQQTIQSISSSALCGLQLKSDTATIASITKYCSTNNTNTIPAANADSLLIQNNANIVINATGSGSTISLVTSSATTPCLQAYPNGVINLNTAGASINKLLVLNDIANGDAPSSAYSFYGFGYNTGTLRYQVPTGTTNMWYSGNTAMMQLSAGNLTVTGDITAFGSVCDRRFKEKIEELECDDALSKIMKLKPVSYKWKTDIYNKEMAGKKDIGFIAQDMEEVCEMITGDFSIPGDDEKYKKIKYEKIIPYLVKTVQHLVEENNKLKEKLNY